jgi:hypothetical protein
MRRWKKLLLGVLILLLVSQIPFAYRRYKLGRLNAAIQQVNSDRSVEAPDGLTEYTGVVHVHSFLGGHSKGGFQEIISAARSNDLDFVVMTEHALGEFNTAAMTLQGTHAGVLFINGNEVSTASSERLLVVPGDGSSAASVQEVITSAKRNNALAFVAYPDEFKSWNANGYDGIEVYNVYTNTRQINPLVMFFDGLWSYRSYPHLLFANFYSRPAQNLKTWDGAIANTGRRLVAIAGNDAHANVGFELTDGSGKKLLGLSLDPYERSFRLVRMHVLAAPSHDGLATQERVLTAIAAGNCFIGYDVFGDTTGFRYTARDDNEQKIMGDEITLENQVHLRVKLPVVGRIVFLKDGTAVHEAATIRTAEFIARERGSYRVEVYLPRLPKPVSEQPWIISNPIYVR